MYGTTENPDRRVDKSFPSLSPPSSEEANKPYYNDKLGNDLEKSFDDLNHNSAGKSMMTSDINGSSSVNGSSSSTRKPYPSPGKFSGRFPIKQSPSSSSSSSLSNDKTVKKPNVQPIDNNDINLLSPINQNTQHNSGMNCKQLNSRNFNYPHYHHHHPHLLLLLILNLLFHIQSEI